MSLLLCPSMMCADFGCLREEIRTLEQAGCDMLHLDVMDGRFVPNFALGFQDVAYIAQAAQIPVDVHLMIEEPGRYIRQLAALGASIAYIHPEADVHAPRTLQTIIDCGMEPGIALNPGTAVETVELFLPLCRYVLVMAVNPGFAGQQYLPWIEKKLERLLALRQEHGYRILIDGACSPERLHALHSRGIDGFVLGTSALFGQQRPYGEIIAELRGKEG